MTAYADTINLTREYVLVRREDTHIVGSIQQARELKEHLKQLHPDEEYAIAEMRGRWEQHEPPKATGHILEAMRNRDFVD